MTIPTAHPALSPGQRAPRRRSQIEGHSRVHCVPRSRNSRTCLVPNLLPNTDRPGSGCCDMCRWRPGDLNGSFWDCWTPSKTGRSRCIDFTARSCRPAMSPRPVSDTREAFSFWLDGVPGSTTPNRPGHGRKVVCPMRACIPGCVGHGVVFWKNASSNRVTEPCHRHPSSADIRPARVNGRTDTSVRYSSCGKRFRKIVCPPSRIAVSTTPGLPRPARLAPEHPMTHQRHESLPAVSAATRRPELCVRRHRKTSRIPNQPSPKRIQIWA